MKRRYWPATDVATLRELYPTGVTPQIAERLRMPVSVVQNKAQKLGPTKAAGFSKAGTYHLSDHARATMRKAALKRWQSPEMRKKWRKAVDPLWQSAEWRAKISKGLQGHPVSEATRRKVAEARTGKPLSEAHLQRLREAGKRLWDDPIYRAKVLERSRNSEAVARSHSPEWRAKVSKALKQRWAAMTAEERFVRTTTMRAAYNIEMQANPSSIERAVGEVLTRWGVEHVAQKQIGSWFIDFYLPQWKMVLECDGDYWHGPLRPEQQARDARKDGWMAKHGYRVCRLTESAIRSDVEEAVRGALAGVMPSP